MTLPTRLRDYIASLDPEEAYTIVHYGPTDRRPTENAAHKVVEYEDDSGLYHLSLDQPAISTVIIRLNDGTVAKTVSTFAEFDILGREVGWLIELQPTGIAPRLLSHTTDTLTLDYRGEPVRQYNLPKDWREQASDILAALSGHGCSHNDIKCDNLVVLDGRLSLIDFGWATRTGDPIPPNWPQGIGRQHRLDIHTFNDEKAIFEALLSAERNMIDRSIVMKR